MPRARLTWDWGAASAVPLHLVRTDPSKCGGAIDAAFTSQAVEVLADDRDVRLAVQLERRD